MACSESHHLLAERRTEDQVTRMMVIRQVLRLTFSSKWVGETDLMVIVVMLLIMAIVDNHD